MLPVDADCGVMIGLDLADTAIKPKATNKNNKKIAEIRIALV
jgi:hypothetical protein